MSFPRAASLECRFGSRRAPEEIRREGWRELGILVVDEADPRLTWLERELVRGLGNRLMGKREQNRPNNKGEQRCAPESG